MVLRMVFNNLVGDSEDAKSSFIYASLWWPQSPSPGVTVYCVLKFQAQISSHRAWPRPEFDLKKSIFESSMSLFGTIWHPNYHGCVMIWVSRTTRGRKDFVAACNGDLWKLRNEAAFWLLGMRWEWLGLVAFGSETSRGSSYSCKR